MSSQNARKYPGQLPGEVLFAIGTENSFAAIGWKSKRLGDRAVDAGVEIVRLCRGQKLGDQRLIFTQRSELDSDTLKRLGSA